MGTREDCENGHCTSDNQGFCWWCGNLINPDWYEAYITPEAEESGE